MSKTQPPIDEFTGCIAKILSLGEPGTWTARLRRWVVLYKRKSWKKWRIDEGFAAYIPARQRNLLDVAYHTTRKRARIIASAYRSRGYSARVRKAFIEIPLEP